MLLKTMENRKWDAATLVCLASSIGEERQDCRPLTHRTLRRWVESGLLNGREWQGELEEGQEERVSALLQRLEETKKLLARYEKRGYRVIVPSDKNWPKQLSALGALEPAFLFVRGNEQLFCGDKHVSVAGSRNIGEEAVRLSRQIGLEIAKHGRVLVSGGARGVDSVCQDAVLGSGGNALLFPAVCAGQLARRPACSAALEEGRLLLACETLPDEPFSAPKALSRNHMIYAMGRPALVVAARSGRGGSWRGAADCLKGGWSKVGVLLGRDADFDGCRDLETLGAHGITVQEKKTIWPQIEALAQSPKRRAPQQTTLLPDMNKR